jgi:hypothetical protein
MEVDFSKKRIWGPETVMGFGKFREKTAREVATIEPTYLLWCQKNVEFFELDEDFQLEIENKLEEDRLRPRRTGPDRPVFDHRDHGDDLDDEIPF